MTTDTTDLIERAKKARTAVYLATDALGADDLSGIIDGLLKLIPEPPIGDERAALIDHLNGMMDSLDESVTHDQVYEQLRVAFQMALALPKPSRTAHTPEPPTDDELEAVEAVIRDCTSRGLTYQQAAKAITNSDSWRNRHHSPITDEAIEAAMDAWHAKAAYARRERMHAALEAAEGAR